MRWAFVGGVAYLVLCASTGCYFVQSAKAPVTTAYYGFHGPRRAQGLVVFLPGMFDDTEDFKQRGFLDTLRRVAPGYDAAAVNLHVNYYSNGTFATRLHDDVVVKARSMGYREVWLVGISIGGFGALHFARKYPGLVDGVIALAPFLGAPPVLDEVRKAGGACAFSSADAAPAQDEESAVRRLWAWFGRHCRDPSARPAVYLGYGHADQLRRAADLLADALPAGHVATRPGGHSWTVWGPLFETLGRRSVGGSALAAASAVP